MEDLSQQTALHDAVDRGHHDITKYLIEAGARIDVRDEYGKTPLSAAWKKKLTTIKHFIDNGELFFCCFLKLITQSYNTQKLSPRKHFFLCYNLYLEVCLYVDK